MQDDVRHALIRGTQNLDDDQVVAPLAGQLRAAGIEVDPEIPDDRPAAVRVSVIREVARRAPAGESPLEPSGPRDEIPF